MLKKHYLKIFETFFQKRLDFFEMICYYNACSERTYGGIAQLGERLNGIQEVSGSIPLISTKKTVDAIASAVFLLSAALDSL